MTILDSINNLKTHLADIKTALSSKGVSVTDSDNFSTLADKINSISTGGNLVEAFENGWADHIGDVSSTATKISQYALYNSNISDADFPECLSVGVNAMQNSRIETANFPKCLRVRSNAFKSCTYLTSINFPICTNIDDSAFYGCNKLTEISLPACTNLSGWYTFSYCTQLKSISLPSLTNLPSLTLSYCTSLTTVDLPACTTLENSVFQGDSALEKINLPVCTMIKYGDFQNCKKLATVVLPVNSVCSLDNKNAFTNTPIASGTGYIYVPDDLVDSYKVATNWSVYADQIKSISELEE